MSSRADQKREAREAREQAEREATAHAAHRRRTAYLAGGIGLIALIVVVALVLVSQSGDDGTDTDPNATFAGIEQSGIAMGDPQAPVTVVEFADLQCPFCRDFAVDDLPAIVEDYVEPGDVRMELQLLAFIQGGSDIGREVAFGAAEQDRLWQFAEAVYANQGTEGSGYMDEEFLREQAESVDGLDADAALAAIGSPDALSMGEDADAAAQSAGVNSTPTFLVRQTEGGGEPELVSASELPGAIDRALAEADG